MTDIPARGFPDVEFTERTRRAQDVMAPGGFDALLLTTEADVRYFTGFLTPFWQSPTRPWFAVVPATGKPVAVIPEIGADAMGRTWIDDIRTWPSPAPEDEGVSLLVDCLTEIVGAGGRVGTPRGPESHLRMPLDDFDRVRARLHGVEFVDATPLVRGLRLTKSAAEIAKIEYACRVVSDVFATLPDILAPGMSEIDVFRRFRVECLSAGVDDVPYLVGGAGAGGYGDIISPPSDRPLQAGDILTLDTGAVFDGYFCDFNRNYAVGTVDTAARRAHEVLWQATAAGLAAAVPGSRARDLFDAMNDVLAANGAPVGAVGRMGHGLGMQLTEPPSNTAVDDTRLLPAMVITLEPSIAFAPGRMMVHEENLVMTDGGHRLLSVRAPAEMPVIG